MQNTLIGALLALSLFIFAGVSGLMAHGNAVQEGDQAGDKFTEYGEQLEIGRVGKTSEVRRTVEVAMTDQYRFSPEVIRVRNGETVRLVFRNTGAQVHEWVLGTPEKIAEHSVLMKRFPNMEHDEPHYVHVSSGKSRTLVWQFNRPGKFEVACLLPGHFEAGMKGIVEVQ